VSIDDFIARCISFCIVAFISSGLSEATGATSSLNLIASFLVIVFHI
jgi:hypothetical protein